MLGVVQAVADFLVDERCHGCGARVSTRAKLPLPGHPASDALDDPVRAFGIVRTRLLCRACLHELDPWPRPVLLVERGRGADAIEVYPTFTTDARLLALVHLLKFGRRACVAPWLGRAMARGLPARARAADVLVTPVPMDDASRRRRGFNQAEALARALARQWGLPLATGVIDKPAPTAAQSLLGREARERNLAAAFGPGRRAALVTGRDVLLVDDLVTTGATARACARALRSAGAARVRVVCAGYRP
ncbi:MAG TPA: phosphoribosyltransferase family protein [Candidatus Krumholzibacteria bacterium]|nr:phosphoribosyltransferase family protein [Candidatus Krumholzibacteria bacterium]